MSAVQALAEPSAAEMQAQKEKAAEMARLWKKQKEAESMLAGLTTTTPPPTPVAIVIPQAPKEKKLAEPTTKDIEKVAESAPKVTELDNTQKPIKKNETKKKKKCHFVDDEAEEEDAGGGKTKNKEDQEDEDDADDDDKDFVVSDSQVEYELTEEAAVYAVSENTDIADVPPVSAVEKPKTRLRKNVEPAASEEKKEVQEDPKDKVDVQEDTKDKEAAAEQEQEQTKEEEAAEKRMRRNQKARERRQRQREEAVKKAAEEEEKKKKEAKNEQQKGEEEESEKKKKKKHHSHVKDESEEEGDKKRKKNKPSKHEKDSEEEGDPPKKKTNPCGISHASAKAMMGQLDAVRAILDSLQTQIENCAQDESEPECKKKKHGK